MVGGGEARAVVNRWCNTMGAAGAGRVLMPRGGYISRIGIRGALGLLEVGWLDLDERIA